MLPENIVYIGVLINLICTVWYIRSIFYKGTRPNLVSWIVWMIAPFIGVFFQLKAGATASIWGTFMAGFGPLLVVIFSVVRKNSFWKINYFDIICGLFSVIALIIYILTHNLAFSILFAIASDGLAYIPTIIKSLKFPETENSSIYIAGIIANILSLLVIKDWVFAIYGFSAYLIIFNTINVIAMNRKKLFNKNNEKLQTTI